MPPVADVRQRLVVAAYACVARHGMGKTTVEDIGREAGVSRATVYRITEEAEEDAALLSYLEARGLTPGAEIMVQAASDSLDAITVVGPRGSATLGLRPAALIRVIPGQADPTLFHRLPAGTGK